MSATIQIPPYDPKQLKSHAYKLTLRAEVWQWISAEAFFLGSGNAEVLSDLITTLYESQRGEKSPEVVEFVPDTGPDWEDIVKEQGAIYG